MLMQITLRPQRARDAGHLSWLVVGQRDARAVLHLMGEVATNLAPPFFRAPLRISFFYIVIIIFIIILFFSLSFPPSLPPSPSLHVPTWNCRKVHLTRVAAERARRKRGLRLLAAWYEKFGQRAETLRDGPGFGAFIIGCIVVAGVLVGVQTYEEMESNEVKGGRGRWGGGRGYRPRGVEIIERRCLLSSDSSIPERPRCSRSSTAASFMSSASRLSSR